MNRHVLLVLCLVGCASIAEGRGGERADLRSERRFALRGILQDAGLQQNNSWSSPSPKYRSNEELAHYLQDFVKRCSHIARLYSIGKSTRGIPLWALEISDKPGVEEPEPAVKYVGNMHGDEPLGRELLPMLAEFLCSNYKKDPLATTIVDRTHLHLLPAMNPDGFAWHERSNAANIDLNRDFPDQFDAQNNNESRRQPETKAVMDWTRSTHFVLAASFHEGALVANYPWDGSVNKKTEYSKCPDDETYRFLAALYASGHPGMLTNREFKGGVTNGAAWYPLYGGMQDWNYLQGDCLDLTIEANDEKWPPAEDIKKHWELHKRSLLKYASLPAKMGIHGTVLSAETGKPLAATVRVNGIEHNTHVGKRFGDFYRILAPGHYQVTVSMADHKDFTTHVNVTNFAPTLLKVRLQPLHPQKTAEAAPQVKLPPGNAQPQTTPASSVNNNKPSGATKPLTQSPPVKITPPTLKPFNGVTPESKPSTLRPPVSKPLTVTPPKSNPSTLSPPVSKPLTVTPPGSKPSTLTTPGSKPSTLTPPESKPFKVITPESKPSTVTPAVSKPLTATPAQSKPLTATTAEMKQPFKVTPPESKPSTLTPPQSKPFKVIPPESKPSTVTPAVSKPLTATPAESKPLTVTPPAMKQPFKVTPPESKPSAVIPPLSKLMTPTPVESKPLTVTPPEMKQPFKVTPPESKPPLKVTPPESKPLTVTPPESTASKTTSPESKAFKVTTPASSTPVALPKQTGNNIPKKYEIKEKSILDLPIDQHGDVEIETIDIRDLPLPKSEPDASTSGPRSGTVLTKGKGGSGGSPALTNLEDRGGGKVSDGSKDMAVSKGERVQDAKGKVPVKGVPGEGMKGKVEGSISMVGGAPAKKEGVVTPKMVPAAVEEKRKLVNKAAAEKYEEIVRKTADGEQELYRKTTDRDQEIVREATDRHQATDEDEGSERKEGEGEYGVREEEKGADVKNKRDLGSGGEGNVLQDTRVVFPGMEVVGEEKRFVVVGEDGGSGVESTKSGMEDAFAQRGTLESEYAEFKSRLGGRVVLLVLLASAFAWFVWFAILRPRKKRRRGPIKGRVPV